MNSKKITLAILLLSILVMPTFGQDISLSEMEMLCKKNSWVDVNDYLLAKGWSFYNSSKPLDDGSKKITWNYNYYRHIDTAEGWFYLYVDANDESKLSAVLYRFFNETTYNRLISAISKKGYKRSSSNIEDGYTIIKYKNSSFNIIITIEQETREYDEAKISAYEIYVCRTNSLLDSDNGPKRITLDNGSIVEYNLINGTFDGPYKVYYSNGILKASMNFKRHKLTGEAKSYDEDGRLLIDAIILDTSMNCKFTEYEYDENGAIALKVTGKATCQFFADNVGIHYNKDTRYIVYFYENGELKQYCDAFGTIGYGGGKTYDDKNRLIKIFSMRNDTLIGDYRYYKYKDSDEPYYEQICFYKDGVKDGKEAITIHLSDVVYEVYNYLYENGELNGLQQSFHYEGDKSVEFEHYNMQHGKKTGKYRIVDGDFVYIGTRDPNSNKNGIWSMYLDYQNRLDSTVRTIDTTQLTLLERGNYKNGEKDGNWYYKSWETKCKDCNVIEFKYEGDKFKSAIVEFDDKTYYYTRVNERIYMTEYEKGKITKKTGYLVSNNDFDKLEDGDISVIVFSGLYKLDGSYEEYDNEERLLIAGAYKNSQKWGNWKSYYYDQNCVMSRNATTLSESFKKIDTEEPYNGKITINEDGKIYEITVKKGVRNGTTKIFIPGNNKPYAKEKYKNGVKVK